MQRKWPTHFHLSDMTQRRMWESGSRPLLPGLKKQRSLNILSKLKALTRYRNLVVLFSNANTQLNTEVQYKHMFCNAWITGGEAEDRSLSEALVIYTKLHIKYPKEYAINQLAINSDLYVLKLVIKNPQHLITTFRLYFIHLFLASCLKAMPLTPHPPSSYYVFQLVLVSSAEEIHHISAETGAVSHTVFSGDRNNIAKTLFFKVV